MNVNQQEITSFIMSVYQKKKYLYNYSKIILEVFYNIIEFISCVLFTLVLISSNILVYTCIKLNNVLFYQWDKNMTFLDRKRIIKERFESEDKDKDYLIRYYIFLKGSSNNIARRFPYNLFLHRFLKSDEPIMHDHPWSYTTLILCGGYWEHSA